MMKRVFFLGYRVNLECECRRYFHASCIATYLNTSIVNETPALHLTGSVLNDIRRLGFNPQTLSFRDVKEEKQNNCPSCKSKAPKEYTVYTSKEDTRGVKKSINLLSQELVEHEFPTTFVECHDNTDPFPAMGARPRPKKPAAIKKGADFSIHNTRTLINECKEKGQIAQDLMVDEKKLMVIINDGMAEVNMENQEAKQFIINILPDIYWDEVNRKDESIEFINS